MNIVNLRFSDLFNSDVVAFSISSKYRLKRRWKINPRLVIEKRDYDDGRRVDKLKPSIRAKYRRNRKWHYEMEFGYEAKATRIPGEATVDEPSYRIHIGYVYAF